ncbi:HD domain-containing protein [Sulfurospirillum sp. 1612]|uniref:[protein-PII] uridylyltransferase family protein n=1 Tax=Sulfurospirillum sp. 1612 TaxID=3094835 RepID=UPI002F928765
MNLEEKIEELFNAKADDFKISKVIKEHIGDYLNSLDKIFIENQGKDFLVKHTRRIDNFIKIIYKYALRKYFGNYMPFSNSIPLVLVGMGSYGREELCVYSDVDLMIVYKKIKGYNIEPIIKDILTLAWDAGMKLGHRTHLVEELLEASNTDLSIKTAMLESRFLCGSKILWIETQRELESIRNYNKKETIKALLEAYHKRIAENPIKMEPNIKENEGGLRDANTLFWLCKIIYGIEKLKDLSDFILDEEEFKEFRHALEFLYRTRSATHLSAKRKQDVLNLEYIPDVAKKLGFQDKVLKSAQMQLSHRILQSMNTLKITSHIFINKVTAPLMADLSQYPALKKARIEPQLYVYHDTLYATYRKKDMTLLEVLKQLNQHYYDHIKFDISYVNLIRRCDIPAHNNKQIYDAFKALLYKEHIYEIFKALDDASLLHHIAKPFAKVKFLAQFDGYHKYPVDKHTIQSLYHLEHIADPFIASLQAALEEEQKAMMRLVIFFHDIGKGRRGNHSDIGAKIFKAYAMKLGFSTQAIQDGYVLIKHHTLMSNIANRENIYNDKVVLAFVSKLHSIKILNMLYILTYADINGVGEKTYTNFTAKLLKDLYDVSIKSFENPELIGEAGKRIRRENILKKSEAFQKLKPIMQRKILNINSNFFFLKHSSVEIMEIAERTDKMQRFEYRITTSPYLSIEVIRFDDFNIGYLLGKLGFLDLVNMEIYKLFDGKKYFKLEFNEELGHDDAMSLNYLIEDSFDMSKTTTLTKPNILKNEIRLDCEHSLCSAGMSINTKNQKGLMAYVMSRFDEEKIDISMAKIQTIKGKTRNLFLIEKTLYLCENKDKILNLFITE